jgi:hypothetical protein
MLMPAPEIILKNNTRISAIKEVRDNRSAIGEITNHPGPLPVQAIITG